MKDYKGKVLYVDDDPVGCVFGEKLSDNLFSMTLAKGDIKYKGVYQALQYLFSLELEKEGIAFVNYTNLTQVPALINSKMRMHPVRMAIPYLGVPYGKC